MGSRRENKSRRVSGIPDPSYVAPLCKIPKWLSRRRRPGRRKYLSSNHPEVKLNSCPLPPHRSGYIIIAEDER